jgi:hypothetical protein
MSAIDLVRLTGGDGGPCGEGDCPNVYATGRGTIVVQGAAYAGFTAPEGEALVEIPEEVLREAFHALGW